MARLFEKDGAFRVVPMLGDAGAGNIALLLNDPSVDVAFVSIDALSAAAATDPTLSDRLELVVRLAPQEIHVLARTDIDSVADLAGRKVSFGPVGSALLPPPLPYSKHSALALRPKASMRALRSNG
jgi:TRAP-type uncharacterized transport system substrate-binding protein